MLEEYDVLISATDAQRRITFANNIFYRVAQIEGYISIRVKPSQADINRAREAYRRLQ